MRAARINHEDPARLADDPHASSHQETLVDSQGEIRGIADGKNRIWFVQGSRKEKSEEHQEINSQISPHAGPNHAPALLIDVLGRIRFGLFGLGCCWLGRCSSGGNRRWPSLRSLALSLIRHETWPTLALLDDCRLLPTVVYI